MQKVDIRDFKSGEWVQRLEYKSFTPNPITLQWVLSNPELQQRLDEANRLLGRLDAFSELVPEVDYFIKMHIAKEATESSKIEGTRTSFEDVWMDQTDLDPEKRDDWKEVHNYINAVNAGIKEMRTLPISNRLIRHLHQILLQGARGDHKLPGEFRKSQNWIGSSLKHAVFVPPTHEEIPELMRDLEQFIHADTLQPAIHIPELIRIAILHYQFETIHPFLDGNGRIGRLLITLYLIDKKILHKPALYLSDYFERNRLEYYGKLNAVRLHNRLEDWINFFLQGIIETAEHGILTFRRIIALRDHIERHQLPALGRKLPDALAMIQALYSQPILYGTQIAQILEKHPSNVNKLIDALEEMEILTELTGYNRNRIYAFKPYIDLFKP